MSILSQFSPPEGIDWGSLRQLLRIVISSVRIHPLLITFFVCGLLLGSTEFRCSSRSGDNFATDSKVNHAPKAFHSSLRVEVNEPVSAFMQARDDDRDELIYTLVTSPKLGVINVTNTANGAFTYVSSTAGSDSFLFRVNDGQFESNIATVSIQITEMQLRWQSVEQKSLSAFQDDAIKSSGCVLMPYPNLLMRGHVGDEVEFETTTPLCAVSDPLDNNHLLAEVEGCRLLQSIDGGITWFNIDVGSLLPEDCQGVLIHFNPFVPGLIYVAINEKANNARLIRSLDGANHWHMISVPVNGHFETLRSTGLDPSGRILLQARFSRFNTPFVGADWPFGKWNVD